MSKQSARGAALRRLERLERTDAYIGLLDADSEGLDHREERQAVDYVAGITRWKRRLDFIIASFYRGPLERMELPLRIVLRIGLYDLLYLDVPPHAAVNEAVELARERVRPGAGGLVNGLLRSVLRSIDKLPVPSTGDEADDLAVQHSHPTWMVKRWLRRYGREDTERLLAWNNARPQYGLRINTLKEAVPDFQENLQQRGISFEPSPYLPDFVRVSRLQGILQGGLLAEGRCAVQDESAGLVVQLLDPKPGETLVDLCAAPGGKSLFSAQKMKDAGEILAFDSNRARVGLITSSAEVQGIDCITASQADGRSLPDEQPALQADRVLLDAPCSGLGVLSRRADLRWHRSEESLGELIALQDELLDAAGRLVRPGGVLVYSTCTIEPDENEDRVEAFLARNDGFEVESAEAWLPREVVTARGYYGTFPPEHGIDGAFAARLKKVR